MRSAAISVGPDFVGDRWQHFRLQLQLNVVNLEYLTIYISVVTLVCCAEMAELVEMPFGGRLTDVGPRNHVSDRVSSQIHSQLQGVTRQR